MRECLPIVRGRWLFLGLGVVLAMPAVVWSQAGQLGTAEGLKSAFTDTQKRRTILIAGEEQPGEADMKVAKAAANYYLHRLTLVTLTPKELLEAQKEFDGDVGRIMEKSLKEKKNRAYINMFGPALVTSMKEVLVDRDITKNQATVMNAALMLPIMAKLKQDNINDYLVELVKDGAKHDVIRHNAVKGLKEAMPIGIQPEDPDFTDERFVAKVKRDVQRVEALTTYIDPPEKRGPMPPDEKETLKFLRREAIITLAQAGAPAVLAAKKPQVKKDMLEGAVAPTLLKVLASGQSGKLRPGDLQPAPNLQEKIEAALGLCAMKHPYMTEYDPNVATYLIGRTIVDFVDDYNKDYANIAIVGPSRKIPHIAYRTEAKRLSDGLTDFAKNAKNPILTKLAQSILDRMTKSTSKEIYARIDNADVNILRQQVTSLRPKNGNVFKTLPKAPVIDLP